MPNQYDSYTQEQCEWIKVNAPIGNDWKTLTKEFNSSFNEHRSVSSLRAKASSLNIRRNYNVTKEQERFILKNYMKYSKADMVNAFSERYFPITIMKLTNIYSRLKLKTPRKYKMNSHNSWCKGLNKNDFEKHYSNETLSKMKKGLRKNYSCLCRDIWEEHNGKVPKGYSITRIDETKGYDDISNLRMVKENTLKRYSAISIKSGKITDKDIRETLLDILETQDKIKELENDI